MQRSSNSIGCLAGALAKAQTELSNPEKSLVANIPAKTPGDAERLFRYASLATGLDIVRKTLGQHEIAAMQTTAIDQAAGTVNLTTVLAHASGEWIASDWPVCAIADTAVPHRMGAALTYARRYALFTLVGIAGEDDLDAPDLVAPAGQASGTEKPQISNQNRRSNGHQGSTDPQTPGRRNGRAASVAAKVILGPDKSAELRDQFVAEVDVLATAEAATTWAHRILAAKNSLTETDAQRVEAAFQSKLAAFGNNDASVFPQSARRSLPPKSRPAKAASEPGIDKGALALPEPRRMRDKNHIRFVAKQPCLICGRQPADPHHLQFAQPQALGRKVSDEFTVPLCRGHHREVHRCGDEAAWWSKAGVDPTIVARALWLKTHPLPTAPDRISRDDDGHSSAPSRDRVNSKRDPGIGRRRPRRKSTSIRSTVAHGVA